MEIKHAIQRLKEKFPFNVSPHFAAWEFLISSSNPDLSILMDPTPQQWTNLQILAHWVLEPARLKHKQPIKITSGIRSAGLNKLIGGSSTSQHLDGSAIDLMGQSGLSWAVYNDLLDANFPGQVFYYKKAGHVHVALPRWGTQKVHKIFDK